jgi:NADH-quinone oxidoreductase subunit J
VYAGAIMVLFLFVIMLLGAEMVGRTPGRWWFQPSALLLGFILLLETGFIFITQRDLMPGAAALPEGFGSPLAIGRELFINYLLPFEATSVLLLAALVGAIVLTKREKKD